MARPSRRPRYQSCSYVYPQPTSFIHVDDARYNTVSCHDVPCEIRLLRKDMICEMHMKETPSLRDPMAPVIGGPSEGGIDFQAVAEAVRDICYDGWFVLETGGRSGRELQDRRASVASVERTFG